MKLLTVADGFGDSQQGTDWYVNFYKWPEIIGFMTKGLEIVNLSRYGAGNEYIVNCIKHNVSNKDLALIQWATPNRLDLVIDDNMNFWQDQIVADPMYCKNILTVNQTNFWLSSNSRNPNIREYHNKFIGLKQHQLRSQIFVEYATLLLEQHCVAYKFFLTSDSSYLKESVSNFDHWCWHEPFKGMESFRNLSQYAELDLKFNLSQPISLVQFDFIRQFIMPTIDLNWRSKRDLDAVENMLHRKYKEALALKNDSL